MVRLYCICLDGAPPNLMARFARDGTLPHLEKILSAGSWSRALPSLPTVTSVNWTTMATGLHCGSHGRPYSDEELKYFWEVVMESDIPVGLANIEHNEVGGRSFYVGHPTTLADPINLSVEPGGEAEIEIATQDGIHLANLKYALSDYLEAVFEGESSETIKASPGVLSDYVIFKAGDEEGTMVCTNIKYVKSTSSIYVSPIRTMGGFAQPVEIEGTILDIAGPPPVKGFPLFHHRQADLDTALEEEMYHARWFGRIAAGMMGKYEDSLWFHRHNTTDGIGHYYLGLIDEKAYCFDRDNLDANWDAVRRWYQTVDVVLGEIMDADPEARFAMCTDHGHVGYKRLVSLAKLFVDNGLAKPHPQRPTVIDRQSSRVFISAEEIFVNRDELDKIGYEEVRERIIRILRELVDPEDSSHPVALALNREDAQCLSYWGDPRGDIIFMLDGGYFATGSMVTQEVFQQFKVPANSSVHHGCFPGYETEVGSTFSFMAYSGHPGGERDIGAVGVPHLVDFAPTVLAIMGLSDPDLQGRVLWDMIGGHEDA